MRRLRSNIRHWGYPYWTMLRTVMRKLLFFTLLVILPTSALAWNEKGHTVTV
jgi:hypothetical protein